MSDEEIYQGARRHRPILTSDQIMQLDEDDPYLRNLSDLVTEACNAFFKSRGMKTGNWIQQRDFDLAKKNAEQPK